MISNEGPEVGVNLTLEASELHSQQRDEEALAKLTEAEEHFPNLVGALFLKGLIALSHGDYETGLPLLELRHRRLDAHSFTTRHLCKPQWDGKATHKRVLIWGQEGLGDTVMMLRFLPEVMELCPYLQVEVQFPLQRLVRINYPTLDVFATVDRGFPLFDLQCSMLSLPLVLGKRLVGPSRDPSLKTGTKHISGDPYLKMPPDILIEDWKVKKPKQVHMGLAWHGNKANIRDNVRSLPVTDVTAIAKAYDFVPLMREHTQFDDVLDMASLIANLDCVVTVDTLVAHLAGAMGKRVHLMLGVDCDWRWMQKRSDSPWYDSVKIYRQQKAGDWSNVVNEVIAGVKQ